VGRLPPGPTKSLQSNWRNERNNLPCSSDLSDLCGSSVFETLHTPEGRTIKEQLTDAGTSIGGNYREANRVRSRADKRNKMHLCEAECAETQYWLEVIVDAKMLEWDVVKPVYEECSFLLGIFTSANEELDKSNPPR